MNWRITKKNGETINADWAKTRKDGMNHLFIWGTMDQEFTMPASEYAGLDFIGQAFGGAEDGIQPQPPREMHTELEPG